ncbi:hypothetical protein [Endozoicomonas sp. 4G]|uniref:hypothetical protein n=1 Tax=Endozoicomonas sp. 4G TaxID=2872754 RepID=UPI002078AE8D|nr:hypothetical protein [Endozoicomonas sp. 4G]
MNKKEQKCIELAIELKLRIARKELQDLQQKKYESPLKGIIDGIVLDENWKTKIKQILFLPMAFILILFLAILLPFHYVSDILEKRKDIEKARKKITSIKESNISKPPEIKNIHELWLSQKMYETDYPFSERKLLLENWINILYGENSCKSLMLDSKIASIQKSFSDANKPFFDRKEGAPHFSFKCPIDCVIDDIAKQLPAYE